MAMSYKFIAKTLGFWYLSLILINLISLPLILSLRDEGNVFMVNYAFVITSIIVSYLVGLFIV